MSSDSPTFSIIVPCYNSEKSLSELSSRISSVLSDLNYTYELILVNDGSTDKTWAVIQELSGNNKHVLGINLTKNFGQHSSILCGLEHAKYDYVVTMDDDLQHRPEDIPVLFNYLTENDHDLVIASFAEKKHGAVRNIGTKLVKTLSNYILKTPKDFKFSSFRILRKSVANNALQFKVANPVIGFLLLKSTSNVANCELEHDERAYGQSNYNFKSLLNFCMTMILDYSVIPLQLIGYLGGLISLGSFILACYYLIIWWLGLITVSGFTTFVLLICFFFGIQFISIGIIGAYFIRILQNANSHPLYLVKDVTNNEQ